MNIFYDSSKFLPPSSDIFHLCLKRENRLVRFLRDTLLKKKCISEKVYRDLYPTGSTPGILYGLPKVHKTGCPVRPILSSIGTFNYKLAKFFVSLLQPLTTNSNSVHDSFSFAKEISSFPNQNYVMASFDVTSLFTNIPLNESIDLCTELLFGNRQSFEHGECNFDRNNFRKTS